MASISLSETAQQDINTSEKNIPDDTTSVPKPDVDYYKLTLIDDAKDATAKVEAEASNSSCDNKGNQ